MTCETSAPSDLQLQQALRVAVAATDRGDYAGAMKVFKALYGDPKLKAPPDGLSAYGLCVAMEEKQTKKGIELCRAAIAAQFYDSRHYCNLITLHLKKADRKGAVEVLCEALERMPKDAALLALRDKMGYRHPPPIASLSRDNPINRILAGNKRKGGEGAPERSHRSFNLPVRSHLAAGLAALLFFALIFGGTFLVLYRQAYG